MSKKILLGCFEVPGWGGASTSSYKLFELMLGDGIDVTLLNIIAENDAHHFRYLFGEKIGNPKDLDEVYNCFLEGPTYHPHPELEKLINKIEPDIIVGIGLIAALLMRREASDRKLIYVTTGCDQMDGYIKRKEWMDFISLYDYLQTPKNHLGAISHIEKEAVATADYIISHSDINLFLYKYELVGKIYPEIIWFAEWIYKDALDYSGLRKPFHERDIDVIFVASSWGRPEKNYNFVKKIASQCKDLNIHVVGETEKKLPHAEYHGLVTGREELFALMGRSKAIICPSLFDAAPGILFEASAMGCNIIASKNCGNWQICNEALLVDPFNLNNFLEKISLSLSKKYEDNIDYFMKTKSYKNLIETISVF